MIIRVVSRIKIIDELLEILFDKGNLNDEQYEILKDFSNGNSI